MNVPNKEYENYLKKNIIPNLIFEKEKYERASKVIHELKEKHLGTKSIESFAQDDDSAVVISKCRSTDCLHQNIRAESFGCPSESGLAEGELVDRKGCVKAWEELKQAIKPRKNKLTITRPTRGVDVLAAFHWDTPLETILAEIVERLDIKNAAWSTTKDDKFWQVTFSIESGNLSEELLQVLRTFGIGSRYQSSVSLVPCALYYKSNDEVSPPASEIGVIRHEDVSNTAWSRFSSSVRARTNLAQVLHDVRADAALTFDWVFLLLVAAFVAAIGLVENSTVILVASMLISPLMGPITASTLGTAVKDRSLQVMGVKNEFLGLFLSLVMGFLFGLTICAIDERYGVVEDWPTYEMISRCEYRSLWVGVLVAIPSGAGVALAVLGEYTSSLVGVAISASLLPPAVNAGLLWAMALTRLLVTTEELRWLVVQPSELAILGTASLCLTLVNIICIFLAGVAVYKVKEVSPLDRKDISWWKANRSRMQSNKNKDNLNWDAYNKWYDGKEATKVANNDASGVTPGQVDNSTVTFRRRPSVIKRLRTQVDGFSQSTHLSDIYIPMEVETKANLETQTASNNTKDKIQNLDEIQHNYYNLGFQNDEVCEDSASKVSDYPTLKPSLSYTVEAKNQVLLDNKCYDV